MEMLGKLLKFFGYVMVSFCYLNAIFEKQPLYPTYVPGVDQNNITLFWIMFIYQIPEIYIASFILLSYIHSTLTFIMFGIAQVQILNHKISLSSIKDVGFDLPQTSSQFNTVLRQEIIER